MNFSKFTVKIHFSFPKGSGWHSGFTEKAYNDGLVLYCDPFYVLV